MYTFPSLQSVVHNPIPYIQNLRIWTINSLLEVIILCKRASSYLYRLSVKEFMSCSIAILDDDKVILTLLSSLLTNKGYKCVTAQGLIELEGVVSEKIDLILSDVNLPEGNGIELCHSLVAKLDLDIPIIAITGENSSLAVKLAFDYGANDYISKPVQPEELYARVDAQLASKQHSDNLRYYLNQQPSPLVLIDHDLNITFANVKANKLFKPDGVNLTHFDAWFSCLGKELNVLRQAIFNVECEKQNAFITYKRNGVSRFLKATITHSSIDTLQCIIVFEDQTELSTLRAHANSRSLVYGNSNAIKELNIKISQLSRVTWPILITGETGVGKEHVAKTIHHNSHCCEGPFIAVNCAGLSKSMLEDTLFGHEKGAFTGADKLYQGVFEQANKGTLFLDEIGDMPIDMQGALLRVIQEMELIRLGGRETIKLSARLLFATNRDLKQLVAEGLFREDLYYRIQTIVIEIPPLREREKDALDIFLLYLNQYASEVGMENPQMSKSVENIILSLEWPGNIRQIQQVCKSLVLLNKDITEVDIERAYGLKVQFNSNLTPSSELKSSIQKHEINEILTAIESCGGNKLKAAKKLGISKATLYRKLS